MAYLKWDETTITDFSPKHVATMYHDGYVFTRRGKGQMEQTRSIRIDLSKFEMTSENRRIYKKMNLLGVNFEDVPFDNYSWEIGKLAKDFYETKFGPGVFSANKVKELLTDEENSSFNTLMVYRYVPERKNIVTMGEVEGMYPQMSCFLSEEMEQSLADGYAICYEDYGIFHYSYPFYNLNTDQKSIGMSMMLMAILYAIYWKKPYIYLGSAQRPSDTYKLQFKGLEWFDGESWNSDVKALKSILSEQ